ncbi:MAG TPA: GMC family oxidoreductase [Vicinamibacterales bacterium]|nr:GMC family oxidoreductase [Vicinamibacterales bacterium]
MMQAPPPPAARFRPSDVVDFVIVGSGAAGGIIAKELSTAGFTVVVLEQGPRLTEPQFDHDEFGTFMRNKLANDPATQPQTFRATPQDKAEKQLALIYGRLVGGSNAHFTANVWRLHPTDFNEASTFGSIAGASFVDWPITYDDLEPYYTKVDWEIGVSGEPGPFDPRRSKAYPMPPLPVKSSGVLMDRAAQKLGLHSQPAPMAINSQYYNGRPACQHCGFCLFFMCEYRSKSTSMVTMLPVAEATGRCEIRPNSYVARVEVGSDGRATGVSYFDAAKRLQLQKARSVVVCANGGETPRLLLNSSSSRFPNGLANSSGMVGKHLMFNTYYGVNAQFEQPLNEHKSVQNTRIVLDFYDADAKRGFYGGGGIDARFGKYPITFALGGLPPGSPTWGDGFARGLAEQYTRSMFFGCHGTSLPQVNNSVEIDPSLKDAWGLPAMRVTYKDHPDDLKNAAFLVSKASELAQAAGALKAWPDPIVPQTNSVHLLGTCRMGNDPRTSVVDKFNRTHDVKNLFLCDGSSLVTSTRGQPTMTIMALAFRAGENIAAFAKRGEI